MINYPVLFPSDRYTFGGLYPREDLFPNNALYPHNEMIFEMDFNSEGLGVLEECIECIVTEERNGAFYLEMVYPVAGKHFADIKNRNIILAKANKISTKWQPFRIKKITKPLNGRVSIYAEHLSYDLADIPVAPFEATNAAQAMMLLKQNSITQNDFVFSTDKTTTATMKNVKPYSCRNLMGGQQSSVLDIYGGEYEFDVFEVKLHAHRGENRGVSIRYGKNLTDLKQEENIASMYTGVCGYWYKEDQGLVNTEPPVINAEGSFEFSKVMTRDFSSDFDEKPTPDQLKTRVESYMKDNNVGRPKVSINVSFIQVADSQEFQHLTLLEEVGLCDTVNIEYERLGVKAEASVYKTVFNTLRNRYESIELGDTRTSLNDTIASVTTDKIDQSTSMLEDEMARSVALITGVQGGNVVFWNSDTHKVGSKENPPNEILVMNSPDILTATSVWRFNKNGLFHADRYDGYNANLALDMEGRINANLITTGRLKAIDIYGCNIYFGGDP